MKKVFNFTLIIAFVLAIAFTGCKKYDNGPSFSLMSKKARVAGTWKFKSVIYDGTDETEGWVGVEWKFSKDGDFKFIEDGFVDLGTWDFASDKEEIDLTWGGDTYRSTIKRLTNKEMWLEGNYDGDIYTMKLTAK